MLLVLHEPYDKGSWNIQGSALIRAVLFVSSFEKWALVLEYGLPGNILGYLVLIY